MKPLSRGGQKSSRGRQKAEEQRAQRARIISQRAESRDIERDLRYKAKVEVQRSNQFGYWDPIVRRFTVRSGYERAYERAVQDKYLELKRGIRGPEIQCSADKMDIWFSHARDFHPALMPYHDAVVYVNDVNLAVNGGHYKLGNLDFPNGTSIDLPLHSGLVRIKGWNPYKINLSVVPADEGLVTLCLEKQEKFGDISYSLVPQRRKAMQVLRNKEKLENVFFCDKQDFIGRFEGTEAPRDYFDRNAAIGDPDLMVRGGKYTLYTERGLELPYNVVISPNSGIVQLKGYDPMRLTIGTRTLREGQVNYVIKLKGRGLYLEEIIPTNCSLRLLKDETVDGVLLDRYHRVDHYDRPIIPERSAKPREDPADRNVSPHLRFLWGIRI